MLAHLSVLNPVDKKKLLIFQLLLRRETPELLMAIATKEIRN